MTIEHDRINKTTVALIISGRLDAANAPLLEQKIKQWAEDITELILDFAGLEYISSVGLRVLLQAKKNFRKERRKLTIKNMNETIQEVFEMTGFLKLMVLEEQFIIIRKNEPGVITLSFNGQMQSDDIAGLTRELADIEKTGFILGSPVTVIFDMGNLSLISSYVCKLLKESIDSTAWDKRTIKIQNVSLDILHELESADMGELVVR